MPIFFSLGTQCRFEPSCSRYTQEAIHKFGFFKGSSLGLFRLSRCHPLCKGGHDPVPEKWIGKIYG